MAKQNEELTSYITSLVKEVDGKVDALEQATIKIFSYFLGKVNDDNIRNNEITESISYIQKDIKDLSNSVSYIKQEINSVKSDVKNLSYMSSNMSKELSVYQVKLDALEQEITANKEEKKAKEEKKNKHTFIWKIFHVNTLIKEKKLEKKRLAEEEERKRKEAEEAAEQERIRQQKQLDAERRRREEEKRKKEKERLEREKEKEAKRKQISDILTKV